MVAPCYSMARLMHFSWDNFIIISIIHHYKQEAFLSVLLYIMKVIYRYKFSASLFSRWQARNVAYRHHPSKAVMGARRHTKSNLPANKLKSYLLVMTLPRFLFNHVPNTSFSWLQVLCFLFLRFPSKTPKPDHFLTSTYQDGYHSHTTAV